MRSSLPAVLLGLSLSLAACSGSDDSTPDPTASASDTSPAQTAAPEPPTTTSSPSTPEPPARPDGEDLTLSVVGDDRQKRIIVGAGPEGDASQTLAGKLIIGEGACYYATTRDAAPTLLVFPEGAAVDADRRPSVVLGGQAYPVGSALSLRGGPVEITEQGREAIRPCSPDGGAFLVTSVG